MNTEEVIWREGSVQKMNLEEVHVWRAPLNVSVIQLNGLRDLLTPDECDRANRFHFEKDRIRFVAARGYFTDHT